MIADTIASLARQVIGGTPVDRAQADWLVERVDADHRIDLYRAASRIRDHFLGNRVTCCSIVAAQVGGCSEDCAFCSQSAHFNTHVKGLTTLNREQVLTAAREAAANGAESFGIVNSGLGPSDEEIETWGQTMATLRKMNTIRVCASLGILTASQSRRLAEWGVQRYNHNLQTSRRYYPNIVSTHRYDDRLDTLHHLKASGISLCSGALFGMGERWGDRLDLAFELRDLEPDVVPLNFLIPIQGTPLSHCQPLEPAECLTIIAIYRFLLPESDLKIAGGREVNLRDLQSWIFLAGASSFMLGNYLTTCGRPTAQDRQMIRDLGLTMAGYAAAGSLTPTNRPPRVAQSHVL